jgi:drug/metabolite transporter (DMT)-like permease
MASGNNLATDPETYPTTAEVGLFALLETTLGPIWVWLGIGERPTDIALVGGLIVISALFGNGLLDMRNRSVSS